MLIALTRAVPASITDCELTHLTREPIDLARVSAQHQLYEEALIALGCTVQRLPSTPELPDSVFVEDTAIVLPEIAIITRPGAASRRPEVDSVAAALRPYRRLVFIEPPGTIDGGDVLCIGSRLFVGRSDRTSDQAIDQLRQNVEPFGYEVVAVGVTGCLHLKTAVTQVAEGAVLLNPAWIDRAAFEGLEQIDVHPDEPFAANALRVGEAVLYPTSWSKTRRLLEQEKIRIVPVEADELMKAEAGVTCCSILFTC
jgi:dimethylargininase